MISDSSFAVFPGFAERQKMIKDDVKHMYIEKISKVWHQAYGTSFDEIGEWLDNPGLVIQPCADAEEDIYEQIDQDR